MGKNRVLQEKFPPTDRDKMFGIFERINMTYSYSYITYIKITFHIRAGKTPF